MESPKQNKSGSQSAKKDSTRSGGGGAGAAGGATGATAGEFIVGKILGKRIVKNEAQYHVKWEGYSMAEATWEPFGNLQYNVVRTRFDDRLKSWAKKHDELGTGARVSEMDREIVDWTAKQPSSVKPKFARNNEELRSDRVDPEWKEMTNASKHHRGSAGPNEQQQQQHSNTNTQQSLSSSQLAGDQQQIITPAKILMPNVVGVATDFSTPKHAASNVVNGGNSTTPTPTGIQTPVAANSSSSQALGSATTTDGVGGGSIKGGVVASQQQQQQQSNSRRKRTSPYPEWVAVARKRLLSEKRNVLKIYSLSSINDVPCYKVQLDGLREPEYIPTVLVKNHHPNRVIEFYEDHLTVPSPSKDGKRIKLKDLFAEMQQQQQQQQQQQLQAGGAGVAADTSGSNAMLTSFPTPNTTQSTNNELSAFGENDHHYHNMSTAVVASSEQIKPTVTTNGNTSTLTVAGS